MTRRQFMIVGAMVAASIVAGASPRSAWATAKYQKTIAVLQYAYDREMALYYEYLAFGKVARAEGYIGIAYLFIALGTAELIHAQNFGKILSRLGVELPSVSKPAGSPAKTRENLIKAADAEIDAVDVFYPEVLQELEAEGMKDAILATHYAWESEKQHQGIIKKIQRWSPSFFERVARTIDEHIGPYFVCQVCGSTMTEIPPDTCPICKLSSRHYRKIEIVE
ncbi:MAG: hypothetical protein OEW32_15075 [Nitrospira sp.]|nr:hypothetical protein [Nitrospira sp.]